VRKTGRIGKLQHINVWCIGSVPGGSTAVVPVPAGFDYDRWLASALTRKYPDLLAKNDPHALQVARSWAEWTHI
jgi:hypothetical protein